MSSTVKLHFRDKDMTKILEPPFSMEKVAALACEELKIRERDFRYACKTYYVNSEKHIIRIFWNEHL